MKKDLFFCWKSSPESVGMRNMQLGTISQENLWWGMMSIVLVATEELAYALKEVQKEANQMGYGLLVWDAYRPQELSTILFDGRRNQKTAEEKKSIIPISSEKNCFLRDMWLQNPVIAVEVPLI